MGLYESFGFRLNGDIDDEGPVVGVVMELLHRRKYKPVKTGFLLYSYQFLVSFPYLILFYNLIECS